jgi:CRISPR-associated protein Cmr3
MSAEYSKQWRFTAIDTWFFRECRPYSDLGGTELTSVFPPPARTVVGAIRSMIGEYAQVDWPTYRQGKGPVYGMTEAVKEIDFIEQLGNPQEAESLGKLQCQGPYLLHQGKRLYPVPLTLLEKEGNFTRLRPGQSATRCDLGNVRLPELEAPSPGAKPLENAWVTADVLEAILAGEKTSPKNILKKSQLFVDEPRLGIGLDKITRTAEDKMMYQTQHLRPCKGIEVGMIVKGIDPQLHPPTQGQEVRFGGEGRLARVTIEEPPPKVTVSKSISVMATRNLLLMLVTPAHLGGWLLPDFKPQRDEKLSCAVWHGQINGIRLKLICAVLGKAIREGGWNLAKRQPQLVTHLVPAGSVYFCELEEEGQTVREVIDQLNGFQIGQETAFGRGELAVGIW